jgi:tetratricopeptide (TPR) repeat protein
MRGVWFFLAIFLATSTTAQAQLGKKVAVPVGTPEDAALSEIYNANDPAAKIALLDKFMAEYGKGDMALLGYQLYVSTYEAAKNPDKVIEYGEKVLELDPTDLGTAVTTVRAAQEKGDANKMFTYGEKAGAIVRNFKAEPAPEGKTPAEWDQLKAMTLRDAEGDLNFVEYALYSAAYQVQNPSKKAVLCERFAAAFPDSQYAANALEIEASAYQQAQNYTKMSEIAQKILTADPNNVAMLLLLSDSWSEQQKELDKSEAYAKKALEVLSQAKKPGNFTDQQWQQQVNFQKGLAYTVLGQVYVIRGRNAPAVDAFKQADPLLKQNAFYYGRNLYRLGFTLAKMQRIAEAKFILGEAVKVNSPFSALAQQTLDKISTHR